MATFSANFAELMETRQKMIFFKEFAQEELQFPKLFQRRPSTKSHEDRLRVAGLGTFQSKPEGAPVAFDDPIQGTRRRVTHSTFALGTRSTWEAIRDDQWDILDKMPADMGDSGRDHMERVAWDLINDGFTGNRHTGLDGLQLFTTAHTTLRPEVATQSNSLNPPLELSVTGLETILTLARLTVSEEGRFTPVSVSRLLYHPDEQHNAYVLLDTEFRPGSGDNDRSTVRSTRSGLTPVEERGVPYLTSSTAWSVHVPPGRNSLTWNDREQMFFQRGNDANTFDQLHYAAYRASVMFSEWRGNYGSNFA